MFVRLFGVTQVDDGAVRANDRLGAWAKCKEGIKHVQDGNTRRDRETNIFEVNGRECIRRDEKNRRIEETFYVFSSISLLSKALGTGPAAVGHQTNR